jgi:flagellar basal-body rod protein FlgB
MKLFDQTLVTLESSLDVRLERQNLLSANVANADTPHYRPVDLDFGKALAQAQHRHDPGTVPSAPRVGDLPLIVAAGPDRAGSAVIEPAAGAPGIDGNRVDLDRAMASLSENALQYSASTRSVNKKLALLRYVAEN